MWSTWSVVYLYGKMGLDSYGFRLKAQLSLMRETIVQNQGTGAEALNNHSDDDWVQLRLFPGRT